MKPEDLELLLSTGVIALIILTVATIIRVIMPLIMKNTQDTLKEVVIELKEVVEEMKKINDKYYFLEKEQEKNAIEIEHNKNNISGIYKRIATLEERMNERR